VALTFCGSMLWMDAAANELVSADAHTVDLTLVFLLVSVDAHTVDLALIFKLVSANATAVNLAFAAPPSSRSPGQKEFRCLLKEALGALLPSMVLV